jgi:hypothetical protein
MGLNLIFARNFADHSSDNNHYLSLMTPRDYFFRDVKIGLLCLLVFAALPFAFAFGTWLHASANMLTLIAVGVSALGGGAIWFRFRIRTVPREVEAKAELQKRLQAGETLVTETIGPLEQHDIRKINRLKWGLTLLLVPAMGIVLFVIHKAAITLTDYAWIITPASGVILAFLIYKYGQQFDRGIDKGEKVVVTGFLTDKYTKYIGKTKHYYIVVGTVKVSISRYPYLSFRVGDKLVVELLMPGKWVLRRERVSEL